jgi:Protein of unknown function (DUF3618)
MTGLRDPAVIRKDIAETRQELGDAVEALAAKTNVKARAREQLIHVTTRARERPAAVVAVAAVMLAVIVARRR